VTREAPKAEEEEKMEIASILTSSLARAHPPRELVNGLPGFRTLKPLSLRSSEKVMGKCERKEMEKEKHTQLG
jgi:hypothetical protein